MLKESPRSALTTSSETGQCLLIEAGNEQLAIALSQIKEIVEFESVCVTKVPMVSDTVLGVMNLRGSIIPVLDLSQVLHLPAQEYDYRASILLLSLSWDSSPTLLGIKVNAVKSINRFDNSKLDGSPSFGTRINKALVDSMVQLEQQFYPLLNTQEVFKYPEFTHSILSRS